MVEVVGKSNDPVVQCESCRNLVKYVENDVEYTTKHFNKENIEFSKKIICHCCHMEIHLGNAKWIPSNSIKTKPGLISSKMEKIVIMR